MDEDLLIKHAAAGDRRSMETLIEQNYHIVKGYLIKLTLDEVLSEDLTQETFYRALLNIKKYSKKAKFSSWLIAIGTNLYRDYYRKNKRIVHLEDNYDSALPHEMEIDIENTALNSMEFEDIVRILRSMPVEKRAVFVLKHFYGVSYKEIADTLNCSEGTVKSRLYYCIRQLRHLIRGSGGDEDYE